MTAFITGSHAYGTPTTDSDIDLVVYLDPKSSFLLSLFSDLEKVKDYGDGGPKKITNLRFGKLNLVIVNNEEEYLLWKTATEELQQLAPVTREYAKAYIRGKRNQLVKDLFEDG